MYRRMGAIERVQRGMPWKQVRSVVQMQSRYDAEVNDPEWRKSRPKRRTHPRRDKRGQSRPR